MSDMRVELGPLATAGRRCLDEDHIEQIANLRLAADIAAFGDRWGRPDSLDAAWAAVSAALPEGWMFDVGSGATENPDAPYAARAAPIVFQWPPVLVRVEGPTPVAALRALADRLRESEVKG